MQFIVEPNEAGTRFDVYLAKKLDDSRNAAQRIIKHNEVSVNGKPASTSFRVKAGDVVVTLPTSSDELPAEEALLEIIFEDRNILIVNKPAGLTVHATAARKTGTLVNQLLAHTPSIRNVGEPHRPGIIHRLDRDVSGIMAVAKTQKAYEYLRNLFAERKISKEYAALVLGKVPYDSGTIDSALGRNRKGRIAVKADGLPAITHYEVLRRGKKSTLLRVKTETGRMHQIRVHLKSIGHPIVGDELYAPKNARVKSGRLLLHATKIGFTDMNGNEVEFTSPLPDEFEATP